MIVDLKPSGTGYMEDLYKAGGSQRIFYELRDFLYLDAKSVNGTSIGDDIKGSAKWSQDIITNKSNPIFNAGSIAVLKGSLAPNSAIIKQSAASENLLIHEGKAVVFEGLEDLAKIIQRDRSLCIGNEQFCYVIHTLFCAIDIRIFDFLHLEHVKIYTRLSSLCILRHMRHSEIAWTGTKINIYWR